MIDNITIQNYKSIKNLSINLGRINVFIGANGSGKSNILEAMAIGAAAANRKLDNEFLALRGIRISDPRLMRNAFDIEDTDKPITISFKRKNYLKEYILSNDNADYSTWKVENNELKSFRTKNHHLITKLKKAILDKDINVENELKKLEEKDLEVFLSTLSEKTKDSTSHPIAKKLEKFIIYSPENNELRKFEAEAKIEPLGIYGEGLFKLIKSMDEEELKALKANLDIIDWFEDFSIRDDLSTNERKIQLKDRYIDDNVSFFDQRSANEGFLFLMFYLSLLISKYTPKVFGIDNIDNALNPKLCKDLLKCFVKLSEKNDRQVLLTTHNPAILDGMNINDESQRLFVVFRNLQGITKIKRIDSKSFDYDGNVRLSEAFSRGYIGGLNENMMQW